MIKVNQNEIVSFHGEIIFKHQFEKKWLLLTSKLLRSIKRIDRQQCVSNQTSFHNNFFINLLKKVENIPEFSCTSIFLKIQKINKLP